MILSAFACRAAVRCVTFWVAIVALFLGSPLLATTTGADALTEEEVRERYGITFYGIDLPSRGANLLLVIDASKSMRRKDAARTTPGRRWDTLIDEVTQMRDAMQEQAQKRGVPFTVSIIFEGGDEVHEGIGPFDLRDTAAGEALVTALVEKEFLSGGNFETTFQETLWPFVARHAITYIVYLGDDDIGTYATAVRSALTDWYTAPETKPTAAQRKCQQQKAAWRKHWARWRPTKRGMPTFKKTRPLPPPPKDVTFSCVAIGQSSPLQEEMATLGKGQYIERKAKAKRKRKKKN